DVAAGDQVQPAEHGGRNLFVAARARAHLHAVLARVQLDEGKHVGIGVHGGDAGAEFLGAIDAEQAPAAADLHHAWAPRQGADVEVVHDQVAGKPDLVAVDLRAAVVVEQLSDGGVRSEEHTSELQSRENLVCRLL